MWRKIENAIVALCAAGALALLPALSRQAHGATLDECVQVVAINATLALLIAVAAGVILGPFLRYLWDWLFTRFPSTCRVGSGLAIGFVVTWYTLRWVG